MEPISDRHIGIAGLVISFIGFALTLIQLWRTKKAAEAAQAAAEKAVGQVFVVTAVAAIQQICGLSKEVITLVKGRDKKGAAASALELSGQVSRFCNTPTALALQPLEAWQEMSAALVAIHTQLELSVGSNRLDSHDLIQKLSKVYNDLSSMASKAELSGAINADPK